ALESLGDSTNFLRSFVVREAVDQQDRNGDGDHTDTVVILRDRTTGQSQPLGSPSGCSIPPTPAPEGRGVVEVSQPPFQFAAVAFEGTRLAFLESENLENACNENNDFDDADAILRVFELGTGEIPISPLRAVDPSLKINRRSLALSQGKVFIRTSEAASARQLTALASSSNASGPGTGDESSLSADGRYVAFSSTATTLVPGDTATEDVFVKDRISGQIAKMSVSSAGVSGDGSSFNPSISATGRYVAFQSDATNLVSGDTMTCSGVNCRDIFLHDRDTDADGIYDEPGAISTIRVSVPQGGGQSNGNSQ